MIIERTKVLVHTGPGHIRVDLQHPRSTQSLRPEVVTEITRALHDAEQSDDCRAFVLTSSNGTFCSGFDLGDATLAASWSESAGAAFAQLLTLLAQSPLVTVAMVGGAAIGGGVGLASACDLVLADEHAGFRLTEALFGIVPAMIMSWVVRRIGDQRAFRMMLLTEQVDVATAFNWGLVDRISADLHEGLRQVLVALRRVDPTTVSEIKRCRQSLSPLKDGFSLDGARMFSGFLADGMVSDRLSRLRDEGLLP
jgi:polyketide biosynthesis enoyl-CoA hydratase PksH